MRIFAKEQVKEGISRGFLPFAVNGGRAGSGNLPIGIERAEMIEAEDIVEATPFITGSF